MCEAFFIWLGSYRRKGGVGAAMEGREGVGAASIWQQNRRNVIFKKGKPVWDKFRVDTLRRHDLSGPFATKNALISFWVYLGAWIHRDGMDS
jgi:hypothetical protein